jgi:hypothetical protein
MGQQVRNPQSQRSQSQRADGFPSSSQVSEFWSLDELNKYATQLEDKIDEGKAIIRQLAETHVATTRQLEALKPAMQHYLQIAERHDLMEELLLNPNLLADWTITMLDPERGIYGRGQGQGQQQQAYPQAQGFSRPAFPPMPAPSGGVRDNWDLLDRVRPDQAWRVLDQMTAADFQARPMFVPN